jgi:hypothetical protein
VLPGFGLELRLGVLLGGLLLWAFPFPSRVESRVGRYGLGIVAIGAEELDAESNLMVQQPSESLLNNTTGTQRNFDSS